MNRTVIGIVIAVVAVIAIIFVVFAQKNTNTNYSSPGGSDIPGVHTQTGGSGSNSNSNSGSNSNGSGTSNGGQQTANAVTIEGFAFGPQTITVKKGTTVTWTNNDTTGHTVTGNTPGGPASGTLNNGDTYQFTFNTTGTFAYHCSIHPSMTGTVTVTD